ncbi:wax ester/triacylglycerol synthase family O-acyltransferase [Craterilacuibacter sp.]|uniref:wax ester/triacylglycerol synthase family O-acyltransferase n=1 Tax=Craterilacuibacter sp. TaxID=2870909 RepID=UPI003F3D2DBF
MMSRQHPISHVDTAWLRMDSPRNLMQIVGVMIFDGALDLQRLRDSISKRMLHFDRFRQIATLDQGTYYWRDDPDFDLDHHLKRAILPGDGGKAALQGFVADLASTPLNPHRPLWEWHLVDTSLGGQALVVRIHHAIADGIALVDVLLSMMDESAASHHAVPAKTAPPTLDEKPAPPHFLDMVWAPVSSVMLGSMKVSTSLWHKYLDLVSNPRKTMGYLEVGYDVATELAKLAVMANDSPTRLKGKPASVKRIAWSEPLALPEVKAVGQVLGCSVNDMLLSAAAGAIHEYLLEKGDPVEGLEVRVMVPVNLRGESDRGTLGNRFGLVALELPVGMANPLARVQVVRERMEALKHSYQAALTLGILGVVGMAPKLVQQQVLDLLANKASAVMTNVPGPQKTLYLAGARLDQPMFWVPQSGDIGVGVSILSYDGKVQIGLTTDKGLVPDPEGITSRFNEEFNKLLLLVLMESPQRLADPDAVEAAIRAG